MPFAAQILQLSQAMSQKLGLGDFGQHVDQLLLDQLM